MFTDGTTHNGHFGKIGTLNVIRAENASFSIFALWRWTSRRRNEDRFFELSALFVPSLAFDLRRSMNLCCGACFWSSYLSLYRNFAIFALCGDGYLDDEIMKIRF